MRTWIWSSPEWPQLTLDRHSVRVIEGDLFRRAGRLRMQVDELPESDRTETQLFALVEGAQKTAAIEGDMIQRCNRLNNMGFTSLAFFLAQD